MKKMDFLIKLDRTGKVRSWHFKSQIRFLHFGKDGLVWISTDVNGLYKVDPDASDTTPAALGIWILVHFQ